MARRPFPRNLPVTQRAFATDAAREGYLALCRWPDGFRCPRCDGLTACRPERQRRWQCASPTGRHQVSLTSETILHRAGAA